MQKCFLTATIFFCIVSLELSAQHTPRDRCVCDSLFDLNPHASAIQKAVIYLETAEVIRENMPQKSFSYLVSAFRISILEKNDSLKARARMQMGNYYAEKRRYMKAQEQYLAAWKTYQAIGNSAGEVNALLNIGNINRNLTNYKKSLDYLQKGLVLTRKSNDLSTRGILIEHIGLTYQFMQEYDSANYFYTRALSLFRQAGDRRNEFGVQNCLGSLYLDENRYDEGMIFYKNLLREADSTDLQLMGILYTRIGHIYSRKNDYPNSLLYNLKALGFRQRNRSISDVNSSLINIAGDYYNLDNPASGQLYMDSGLILARRYDQKHLIENGYRHLYNYYLQKGDPKKALDYFARNFAAHDDIIREQNQNNIAILETYQQLQRNQQAGKISTSLLDSQHESYKFHTTTFVILVTLTSLAGFSMLVFVFLLLSVRGDRRRMQELNIQLSDEIREREVTEDQTRDRENQYRFITENSIDFITHMDQQKNRIYASPASLNVYGYTHDEIISKSPLELTHPDDYSYTEAKFKEMTETRSSSQFTYRAIKKDGTVFWVESILNPLFDPITGVFKGMVGVTRDIQERKTKEFEIMEGTSQKENLLKEIHHRVKNNFAILVSLINMQMAQTKNQELLQSLTNLQLRIRTMALVHEMLYRSSDFERISFPGYLRSLASVIAATYNRRDIVLTVEADEVVMDIEASIPLGLVVNEILSNAFKHAFPDGRSGNIKIRFTRNQATGTHTLVVQDDGIGMPAGVGLDQYKTMGIQVVQILCNQIEGTLVVANNPGASFSITFQAS